MNIVTLGTAAKKMGLALREQSENGYRLFAIDSERVRDETPFEAVYDHFPRYENPEDYENVFVKNDPEWDEFLNNINSYSGDIIFIVTGGGNISLASLRILQYLRERSIKLLFIRPDRDMLNDLEKAQERVAFRVLQEYARSGLVDELFIVSNEKVQEKLTDVSFENFYTEMNRAIASILHGVLTFSTKEPVFGNLAERSKIVRISTVGALNLSTSEEMVLFDLTNTREVVYYYGICDGDMASKEVRDRILNELKTKQSNNLTHYSFGIFGTTYPQSYCYCLFSTNIIQED